MNFGDSRPRTGRDSKSWPVLLPLFIVVLLPAIGVLWFMNQAMSNEQLVVQQKLTDVYRARLFDVQQELESFWDLRLSELDVSDLTIPASQVFAQRVRSGLADSVVVLTAAGIPAYPSNPSANGMSLEASSVAWRRAERLERSGDSEKAAVRFAEIARQAADRNEAARALQAQARCLARAKEVPAALAILVEKLGSSEYQSAVDLQGRLIAPSAQLRALQLMDRGLQDGAHEAAFREVAAALADRLANYEDLALPGVQRQFLMKQLRELMPSLDAFGTLEGERLAAQYLSSNPPVPSSSSLQPSGLGGIWHVAAPSGRVVALFEEEHLSRTLEALIAKPSLPEKVTIELLKPEVEPEEGFLVSMPAGSRLQDWTLLLKPGDEALFASVANQRIRAYRLTGFLVVVTILLLFVLVARMIDRRLRLTRLKNDLLATVSHELKTPLASMRLLVDTLLDTGIEDAQRTRDYLGLIAKENSRLSRLVDNFLTFSRMEQGRQSFDESLLSPETVVQAAGSLVEDRFSASGCRFEVKVAGEEVAADLPAIWGDQDALVMVLLNLLDNAYKYSSEERHIELSTYSDGEDVCFSVRDNGPGISARDAKKIFDRFYQVDQSLSRPGSGIGLGLSIVEFIVKAHKGSVSVDSQSGEGSTFTVRLPKVTSAEPRNPVESLEEGI